MVWIEKILGVAILIFAPLAWGLVTAWLFTRRRRTPVGAAEGPDA